MSNLDGIPEISVQEVAQKRAAGEAILLLDVREPVELTYANLGDDVLTAPLSDMAERQLEALPPEVVADKAAEIIVFCHHGGRSAQVTGFLRQNGWINVYSMAGGIDAYAVEIEPGIGRY